MYQEKDIAFHKIFNRYVKERVINQVIIFFSQNILGKIMKSSSI